MPYAVNKARARRVGGAHPRRPAGGRGRRWTLLASVILLAGLATSLAGALWWSSNVRTHDRQASQATALAVTHTLGTLLSSDADFETTLRAVATREQGLTPGVFDSWFAALEGTRRQVGSVGTTVLASVPSADVRAFQTRRNAGSAFARFVGGDVLPIPAAGRTRRCLLSAGITPVKLPSLYNQLIQSDWCNPATVPGITQAPLLDQAAATGQLLVYTVSTEGLHTVLLDASFYRRAANLATAAERRSAVLGWIVSSFDISALIGDATAGQHGVALVLYHTNPGQPETLIGQVGRFNRSEPAALTTNLQIEGTWTVKVQGIAAVSGLSATAQALLAGLAGVIVSLLLFILFLVLTRSREHALGMVLEKTGELRHQASHDPLTGLPNRALAVEHAEQMLARARRSHVLVAALYVDIDGFKHVNDTFGHAVGDRLLRLVAERLKDVVRGEDVAARLGGDEFVILLEGDTLTDGPEPVAVRALDVMRQPYDMNREIGRELWVTVSIGIASGSRESADELLRDADLALYEAKVAGKNRLVVFREEMQRAARDRLTFQIDLAEALPRGELFLQYQPIYALESERMVGVEALIRWNHPSRGVVPPLEFIPIAEESGLIVPIGRWVLEQAAKQVAAWRLKGHDLGAWVNVSARQLDQPELIEDVQRALDRSGLEPGALVIEVTETALTRDSHATATGLVALKRLGIRIAIDDFGTGYSSLGHLRQFPADILKIDRSFMGGVNDTKESAALIHTIIQLGEALGIDTLAEGIEEQVQLETLRSEQCRYGQGFLLSRPIEPAGVERLLDAAPSGGGEALRRAVSPTHST